MRRRGWLTLILLAPLALISIGTQMAALTGLVGVAQTAIAGRARDSAGLERGLGTIQSAAKVLDLTWSSPATRVLEYNPMTLGAMDDLRAAAHALAVSTQVLDPLAEIGTAAVGFDGEPPIVTGTTIDPLKVEDLALPVAAVHEALAATGEALAEVTGSGPLGRPIGAVADSLSGSVGDLTQLAGAAEIAMPDVAEALGSTEPKRYLVAALNDAELFGSGGAPLSAFVMQADKGSLSVPISGQLESKLSPNNPPIDWRHEGGPPWYREGKRYPFVNSNFHPDFGTASVDMRRAWAALGYPEVDGVVTVDMSALASMLAWTGAVESPGFGEISSETLVRRVLVDAYRQFNSPEGVIERHARNEELTKALVKHLTQPLNLMSAVRGTMDAIPPRHLQASFDAPYLQSAIDALAAGGELSRAPGDLIGVHSQSAPNKLSVFQDRRITQEVQLTAGGGATVRRTISFTNAVPAGLEGDPTTYSGYLALRARMRVAYRLPLTATDTRITTGNSVALVPMARTGPFPDERGGQVLWQGHETAPGETTTVVMEYSLPDGTFAPGTYEVHADPQALPHAAELNVKVLPAPGTTLPESPQWAREGGMLTWRGTLDMPLHLEVGQ
jgi:hypothetical protein